MFVDIYLFNSFNNYFNRKIKLYDTLAEYLSIYSSVSEDYQPFVLEEVNFNPNDGITTAHVVGSANAPYNKEWSPDYALVVERETNKILSRWFVIEFTRNMVNQFTANLKRDTVADKYNLVVNAPCYIEKGHLEEDDPMIVNNEGISFNQIKTKEYFLKDETKVPWIVVYLNQFDRPFTPIRSQFCSSQILEIENCPEILALFPDIRTATKDQEVHHKVFDDNNFRYNFKYNFGEFAAPIIHRREFQVNCKVSRTEYSQTLGQMWEPRPIDAEKDVIHNIATPAGPIGYVDNGWDKVGVGVTPRPLESITREMNGEIYSDFNNKVAPIYNAMGCTHHSTGYITPDVKKYIGKIIHAGSRYFVFNIQDNGQTKFESEGELWVSTITGLLNNIDHQNWIVNTGVCKHIGINAQCSSDIVYKMQLNTGVSVKLDLLGTKTEEGHDKAYQTQFEPYDIICFPAFSTQITNAEGTKVECIGTAGINIARAISEQLGKDHVYDVQVLPYCPVRELIGSDGDIDLRLGGERQYLPVMTDIGENDYVVSYCLFATSPFHYFEIDTLGTSIYNDDEVSCSSELIVEDKKISSNCDLYRLSSPNYASSFEFNLAKCCPINRPEITKFRVDIDFRPQNPYIHIAPDFAFLYGKDFNDSRGLICSGDFGLTTLSNAWTDYQVRNKNYQNIFDRQISHMETDFSISQKKQDFNFLIGSLASALNTSVATIGAGVGGAISKNPMGYIAAGGIATRGAINQGAGLASWLTNRGLNREQLNENISYSRDMFNMQMDNIKALPDTITHSAALTNNFKFYPVLEYYTCTPTEKTALEKKIQYNGMTIGRIDNIVNYLSNSEERFVKGQIIRLDFMQEDSHLANDIYTEINKGLFFEPYNPVDRRK